MSTRLTEGREPTFATRPRSPAEALEPGRAPARPRGTRIRSEPRALSTVVRLASSVLTLGLVVLVLAGAAAVLHNHAVEAPGPLEVTRTVVVPRGEGRIEIAARLEREGIISNRWSFVIAHMTQGLYGGAKKAGELKAGEYEIKKGASLRQVIETLTEGKAVLLKITIPEGLTSQQVVERVRADTNLSGEIVEVPPEGSLLPDTYRYSKGMSRQDVIERMQAERDRFLAAAWEKRQKDLPLQSIEQAVVLASIVEKETGRADERERVAAVFVNRLRKGMRLQSDPTIVYGIVGGQGSLGRPITRTDIDTKTPYNTYTIDGLPPGPICNPGRSAIEATLNPAKTNDLYFVADGNGGHTFSETLKEHNAAVSNWRKVEKEMRAKEQGAPATAAQPQPGTLAVSRPAPGQENAVPIPPAGEGEAAAVPAAASPGSAVPLPVRKPKKQ
jgi:UPF0755 protein